MVIFNSYVKLPEGTVQRVSPVDWRYNQLTQRIMHLLCQRYDLSGEMELIYHMWIRSNIPYLLGCYSYIPYTIYRYHIYRID